MGDSDSLSETCDVETLSSKSPKIHRRVGHVAVKYNNFVLVWGGYEDEEKYDNNAYIRTANYHPSDEVLLFDIEYEIWHSVRTDGDAPPKLCGSTAAVCGDSMLLFGGFLDDPERDSSNVRTLYRLDLVRMTWSQLWPEGVPPLPCDKLVSWCYNGQFYVYGGFGPWPDHPSDWDHTGLRLAAHPGRDERCWNNQIVRLTAAGWEWPVTSGDRPGPRAAHAAAVLGRRVYVFGGRMGNRLNDLYCLDMETMVWTKEEPAVDHRPLRDVPQPRSWHSLTPLPGGRLLLYGGFNSEDQPLSDPWLWDTTDRRWSRCCALAVPPTRMWHAAAPGGEGEVVIVGGLASSILSTQPIYAGRAVFVRHTPKTLLRLCLDAVEKHRAALTPDVWLLPPPMVERVMARLTGAGGRLL